MKIVIDIPEEVYERASIVELNTTYEEEYLKQIILDGTPLPKGHGRLGDLDKIADRLEALRDNWDYYGNEYESGIYTGCDYSLDEVMDAPTIIEPYKTESEDKE